MNSITPFQFEDHQVRVVEINGEPWFVLADLCKVLDLAKPSRVARCGIADDMRGAHLMSTPGGSQEMTIVSEAGMYEVVIRSDKPEAVTFRRWITAEVLPQIRRTGAYATPTAAPVFQLPQTPEITAGELEHAHW
ncbi:MAG: Bro-N domain-containing protein [Tessaracoccus sp.]|uniref:BRO-N domain-containing protein n=1 Tax=Tessaracoccus sp. TaxID=1971211 RepID=UPI001EB6BA3D|nr:Bro-N domain-containing protein [Tessaracoccus sp.]MBK7821959.1 Bro-N domain-containing protein [Tessaracoccus sp.]